jgi:hypothetical protein
MKYITSLAAAVLALSASSVLAQTPAPDAVVQVKVTADMPSLIDKNKNDTFKFTIEDKQIVLNMDLLCQQGGSSWGVLRKDRACKVGGKGSIVSPDKRQLPRIQYMGGFTVSKDGYTDANQLKVSYLAVGNVPASSGSFTGSMTLKPELTSSGANALKDQVLGKLRQTAGSGGSASVIDNRVDSIELSGLQIPSAGMPSDRGCTWRGSMIYAYQTESWYMDVIGVCSDKEYKLKGNMPWTKPEGKDALYDLTLTMPGVGQTSDDALFASNSDAGLFAKADGISGQIVMKESRMVKVKVDGKDTENASLIEATGSFTGTRVPLEVVRSFSVLFGILSQGIFGA